MKITEIKVLRGPNYWSIRRPKLIQVKIDLEEMEENLREVAKHKLLYKDLAQAYLINPEARLEVIVEEIEKERGGEKERKREKERER